MKRTVLRKNTFLYSLLISLMLIFSVCAGIIGNTETAYAATYTWGSSGEAVRIIQTKLKQWGYYNGEIDGKYGILTVESVKYFQRKNRLKEDGITGPKTLEAIGLPGYTPWPGTQSTVTPNTASPDDIIPTQENLMDSLPVSTISSRESDVWLLACIINGEGRGESYLGQVAIGAVVMNRVNHPSFPNTIAGVIYQTGAFDAVKDGQINLVPTESCIKAARDALNGWDPVDGSLFYWNPKTATSKWILTLTIVKTIGNHSFAIN